MWSVQTVKPTLGSLNFRFSQLIEVMLIQPLFLMNSFQSKSSSYSAKMAFVKDLEFLHNLGLGVNIFGKDLERLFDGRKNCKMFCRCYEANRR